MMIFSKKILRWFDSEGRHNLPWQQNPTPYRVWVSEIMLQQTQVGTVIPYFERFMTHFPTVESASEALLDNVLKLWSGLGYYGRARNLHKTARVISQTYHGVWPREVAALERLPGIGRSTAGAIASLAFNIPAPILDGNVKRVLSRVYAIDGKPLAQEKHLWELAYSLLPQKRPGHYNQALMDLGATLCTKQKPRCTLCPVQKDCLAFRHNRVAEYPSSIIKPPKPIRHKYFLLISSKDQKHLLLYQRPLSGIWGGLWSLPEIEYDENWTECLMNCLADFKLDLLHAESLTIKKHTFTHFTLYLHPIAVTIPSMKRAHLEKAGFYWHKMGQEYPGGIPAPIHRLLLAWRQVPV